MREKWQVIEPERGSNAQGLLPYCEEDLQSVLNNMNSTLDLVILYGLQKPD